jgi:hypothetical protein
MALMFRKHSFIGAAASIMLMATVGALAQAPPPGPAPAGIIAGVGNFSHIVTD